MRLLARAMTYKLAVLGLPVGGAKIGLRATPATATLSSHDFASRSSTGSPAVR